MKNRFLHLLSGALIWLLFVAAGGALVYANLLRIAGGPLGAFHVEEARWWGLGSGLLMVVIALVYLLTTAPKKPKLKFVTFECDEGAVAISVSAVRDFIRKIGEEFSAIHSLDPKIRAEKDRINLDLDVKIVAGARVPELSQMLQSRVREGIRDGLGIAEIHSIKVRVQEIVGGPPARRHEMES